MKVVELKGVLNIYRVINGYGFWGVSKKLRNRDYIIFIFINIFLFFLITPKIILGVTNKTFLGEGSSVYGGVGGSAGWPVSYEIMHDELFKARDQDTFLQVFPEHEYASWNKRHKTRSVGVLYGFAQSDNKAGLGRYLGAWDHNVIAFGDLENGQDDYKKNIDEHYQYFIHLESPLSRHLGSDGKITTDPHEMLTLRPRRTAHTVLLTGMLDTRLLAQHTFVNITLPVRSVTHDLGARFDVYNFDSEGIDTSALQNFFSGTFEKTTAGYEQAKLTHAKIKPSHTMRSTGLGDAEVLFGYHYLRRLTRRGVVGGVLIIPMSDKPDGAWLWSPVRGNGAHWGLGMHGEYWHKVWNRSSSIDFVMGLDARYLFENSQTRTLGIKNRVWGQYYLVGKKGEHELLPAANVLTLQTTVRPGMQVDAHAGMVYHWKSFGFELGYRAFFKERELVGIKSAWPENTYGIADPEFDTSVIFGNTASGSAPEGLEKGLPTQSGWLRQADLDTNAASVPALMIHTGYCALSGLFRIGKNNLYCHGGLAYDWVSENASPEGVHCWLSAVFNF